MFIAYLSWKVSQNLYYKQNHDIETLPCQVRIGKSCEKQSKQTWRALGFFKPFH